MKKIGEAIDRTIPVAIGAGFICIFGLGIWAATGKLHIFARTDRLPIGLALGVGILICRSYLREQQERENERRIRAAMDDAYDLGHTDAKEKRKRQVRFSDIRAPYVTETFIYSGSYSELNDASDDD
jgi:hypothetical protein